MPQLNKGGKFVFGLSVIRPDLTIHIPPQALLEYGATRDGKVIIFTGSKITGGFCITTSRQVNYCMKWRKQYGLQGNTYKLFI